MDKATIEQNNFKVDTGRLFPLVAKIWPDQPHINTEDSTFGYCTNCELNRVMQGTNNCLNDNTAIVLEFLAKKWPPEYEFRRLQEVLSFLEGTKPYRQGLISETELREILVSG